MSPDDGTRWKSMVRHLEGLSADARLLGLLLAPHWQGDGTPLGQINSCDLYIQGQFSCWETYADALAELHAHGFISTHGRRGQPSPLLTPDLASLHMAGAEGLLAERKGAL